jgi:hypothetical protein
VVTSLWLRDTAAVRSAEALLDRPGSFLIDGHAETRILLLTLLMLTNILSLNHMIRGSGFAGIFAGMTIHAGG